MSMLLEPMLGSNGTRDETNFGSAHLADSLNGHAIAYAADAALRSGTVIDIDARG